MTNIFIYWGDKSYSVTRQNTCYDLFWSLDDEGNPYQASLRMLPEVYSLQIPNSESGRLPHLGDWDWVSQYPKINISMLERAVSYNAKNEEEGRIWWQEKTIKQVYRLFKKTPFMKQTFALRTDDMPISNF